MLDMLIRVLFITLLLFVLPNTKVKAIALPPAPDSVVAPSLAAGSFSVYWSMSFDTSVVAKKIKLIKKELY
jgi:hypothetical protein